jgi:hypothetical protein
MSTGVSANVESGEMLVNDVLYALTQMADNRQVRLSAVCHLLLAVCCLLSAPCSPLSCCLHFANTVLMVTTVLA